MIRHKKRFEQWLPAKFDGEFGWDFLTDAFPGKIEPMDFDAVVERRGHFLIFETKQEGKDIDVGQKITLTAMWRRGSATIIHVAGKTAPTISGFAIYSEWEEKACSIGDKPIRKKNYIDLFYAERCWFCRADGVKVPTRQEWERELWLADYESSGGHGNDNAVHALEEAHP